MATYSNRHWLLSHIRNSFIATDDTGLCEAIMLSEDMPASLLKGIAPRYQQQQPSTFTTTEPPLGSTSSSARNTVKREHAPIGAALEYEFICYPGLDQSDDEETYPLAQSYDILMDPGISFIQRSNTAQKLDQMNLARKRAAKIKNVKCQDSVAPAPATVQDFDTLFERKEVPAVPKTKNRSLLAEQLSRNPKQPLNKFLQYARFDGTGQPGSITKKIRIFLTMLPERQRNYPMTVCVLGTAKIQEFIGLICYKTSLEYPETTLLSVRNYGLYITEEDGEVDADFPPLDLNEPCSKFCFSHLALVERSANDVRPDARTMSLSSEVEALQDALIEEQLAVKKSQSDAIALMLGHTTKMEAPIYRSYQLQISRRSFFKTEIQLGISAEKLEIDPVQQQNSKFWSHQKAISHSMDSVVWCEITDEPSPSRAFIKIVYCPTPVQDVGGAQQQASPSVGSSSSSAQQFQFPANMYRSYKFVTDAVTAQEIVDKVRNIIEVRSSPARRDYLSRRASGDSSGGSRNGSGSFLGAVDKRKKPFKKLFN